MTEEPKKKKILIKRKGPAKSAIKLNKPADEEELTAPADGSPPDTDAAGRKKVSFKKKATPSSSAEQKTEKQEPLTDTEIDSGQEETEAAASAGTAEKADDSGTPQQAPPASSQTEKVEGSVFKFYCVYCGQKLSAYTSMAGKKIVCPSCKNKIEIPTPPAGS